MVERKGEKARNTFVKKARPVIVDGERAGQRDSERVTAFVQVIPDGAFGAFGERKLNGFTLAEIEEVLASGGRKQITNEEGRVTAWVEVGDQDHQFTKDELQQIVDAVRADGVMISPSPMDQADLERAGRAVAVSQGGRNVARATAPAARPGRPRKADRAGGESSAVQG